MALLLPVFRCNVNTWTASTNATIISLALQSQNVSPVAADAIAAGACRAVMLGNSLNESYLLVSAYLVFFMQAGFAMVRSRRAAIVPAVQFRRLLLVPNRMSAVSTKTLVPANFHRVTFGWLNRPVYDPLRQVLACFFTPAQLAPVGQPATSRFFPLTTPPVSFGANSFVRDLCAPRTR